MPGGSRSRLARPRRMSSLPLFGRCLTWRPSSVNACGQLVRPIFQNWRAAGSESCRHDPFGRTSVPLEAVEARRLYRQVADQLRSLIDSGEYAVGSRLPTERELAEQLKISRPTVREALIALEVEGRVRIRVGSGIYVSEPAALAPSLPLAEVEGPFELLRAREFMEGAIAEQAARVATAADIARIDASVEAMATVQHPGEASMIHDRAFHVAVAGCLDNAGLARVGGEVVDQRLNPEFANLAHYFENPQSWN